MRRIIFYTIVTGLIGLIFSCEKNDPTDSISEPAVGGFLRYAVYIPDIKSTNPIDIFVNDKKVNGDSLTFEKTFPSVEYTVLKEGSNNIKFINRKDKSIVYKDTTVNIEKDKRRALFLVGRLSNNSISTFMLDEYNNLPDLPNDSTSFIRLVNVHPNNVKYDLVREKDGVITTIISDIGYKMASNYVALPITASLGEVYFIRKDTQVKVKPTTAYTWSSRRYYTMYVRPGATETATVVAQTYAVNVFNQ